MLIRNKWQSSEKKHKKYMLLDIIDRVLSIFTSLVVFSGAQSKQMTSEDI